MPQASGLRLVDARPQHRARDVELLLRQRPIAGRRPRRPRRSRPAAEMRRRARSTPPIAIDGAAALDERLECGIVRSARDAAQSCERYSARAWSPDRATPPAPRGAGRARECAPSAKISTSNLRVQVAGVERRREHDLERELVLLEEPARPAGRHRAAVVVPQPDARRLQPARVSPAGFVATAVNDHAEIRGRASATRPRSLGFAVDEQRAGAVVPPMLRADASRRPRPPSAAG